MMKTNQIIKLVLVLITILFLIIFSILLKNNKELKNDYKRLELNLSELNTQNSELTFTNAELKKYLKNKDTQHKNEVDSILREHKVEVNRLKKLQIVEVIVKDTVPFYVEFNNTNNTNDTNDTLLYQKDFLIEKNCIRMNGRVFSTDLNSKIEIISIENKNKIFITQSYKKNFWDYILFRKGKLIEKITSDCGNANNSEINIE